MRHTIPLALIVLLAATPAAADAPILLLAGDAPQMEALGSALQLAIAGDGWRVVAGDAVVGSTALQRAATAQAAAQRAGARATLWVEEGPEAGVLVRVVDAAGESPRHAPLPTTLAAAEPRAFAAVAASLLDELVSPPQRLRVRVQVSVEAEGGEFVADGGSARVVAGSQSAEAVLGEQAVDVVVEPEVATLVPPESEPEIEVPQSEPEPAPDSELEAEAEPEPEADVEPEPELEGWWFGADFAPFVGMSSFRRGRAKRHLSVGMFGTLSDGVEGVAMSSGLNVTTGDSVGALMAAGANWSHGNMRGVQLAAGANLNVGTLWGVQASAGANIVVGDVHGAQLSSGVNIATGAMNGLQATSGVNYARGGQGSMSRAVSVMIWRELRPRGPGSAGRRAQHPIGRVRRGAARTRRSVAGVGHRTSDVDLGPRTRTRTPPPPHAPADRPAAPTCSAGSPTGTTSGPAARPPPGAGRCSRPTRFEPSAATKTPRTATTASPLEATGPPHSKPRSSAFSGSTIRAVRSDRCRRRRLRPLSRNGAWASRRGCSCASVARPMRERSPSATSSGIPKVGSPAG